MGSFLRAAGIAVLLCSCLCPSVAAATAQAYACAQVVSSVEVCRSHGDVQAQPEAKLSATQPEMISSPDTVVKFDITTSKEATCSIVLPQQVTLKDKSGHPVATCSLSTIMGRTEADSPVVGVVIRAEMNSSEPDPDACPTGFDVIVAYD